MKRKFLSTLVCLTIIFITALLLPTQAEAASESDLTFTLNDDGQSYSVTYCKTSASGSLTIPATYNGKPVSSIGYRAFANCTSLTSVTIPSSVTSIGDYAFHGCSSLTSVTIGDSVTSIGKGAFRGCTSLTSVTIPDSVTSIGYAAFYGCSSLTSVTIGDSVTSIGESAFRGCSSLTSVTIGDSVTSIGDYAFRGCSSLTSVTIPSSVTSIGYAAFYGCTNLTGIWVMEGNAQYISDNYGVLFNKEKTILIRAPEMLTGNYAIPDSVTTIGDYAFYSCINLTSVTIPDSVTTIGDYAFHCCNGLNGVYITDLVAWCNIYICYNLGGLGSYRTDPSPNPLYWAKNLYLNGELVTDLLIPEKITTINMCSFANCKSLRSVTIPNSVQFIKEGAFSGCDNLEKIYFCGSAPKIQDRYYHYTDFEDFEEDESIYREGAFENVEAVAYYATNNTWANAVKLNYGGTLTWVPYDEKISPEGLKYTIINNQVTITGYTGNATQLSIPSVIEGLPVVSIYGYAFANCSSLTIITIPDSVTSIGDSAFDNCSILSHIAYTGIQSQWDSIYIGSNNTYLTNATRHYETRFQNIDNCVGTYVYCPVCEIFLLCEPYETPKHSYGDWVVINSPTLTVTGQKERTCTTCGDTVTETIAMLVGKVDHWNIVLEDDYAVNFYLQVSESIESTARVRLATGNETVTYNISALDKNEDGYFRLTANVSAAQMNDFITIMVMNGREVGSVSTYTVREYCDTILADPQHSAYHALVKEMLNYGAMAQIYFDYDAEYLANDGITGIANAEVPETADEMIISDKITDLSFYGASLVYRDRVAVRYYFTGDVTDCTFTANGSTYTPVAKDGMYYVEIPDILPQNLDQQITLVVTDAEGNEISVSYSPMNYIVRMNAKSSENLKNLLKALYNYHLAAKELSQSAA